MLLRTLLLPAMLHTKQLRAVNLKPRPELELQSIAWTRICSWRPVLPRNLGKVVQLEQGADAATLLPGAKRCTAADIRASEVMLHCLGHVRTVLRCDVQVCPPQNRKMGSLVN